MTTKDKVVKNCHINVAKHMGNQHTALFMSIV